MPGVKGLDGCNGTDGRPGIPGKPGLPGERGAYGPDGKQGFPGEAGEGGANSNLIKGDKGEAARPGGMVRAWTFVRFRVKVTFPLCSYFSFFWRELQGAGASS